jgi:aminodeoxyfutalosine deaminase
LNLSPTPSIDQFLREVPKVELHLHLVGSASPSTVAALVDRHGDTHVPRDPETLSDFFEFRDFPHFIEVYASVNDLVRDAEDVVSILRGAAADLESHRVRYAEMTVTPYMHEIRGLAPGDLVEALAEGRRLALQLHGVELAWIFDIPGEHGQKAAQRTVELVLDDGVDGLIGFGLAGAESGVNRADYAWAFDKARAAGLRSVPHAGEGDGPESVWAAIDVLHADRIGHGVRAIEDPTLVTALAERAIPLEVCPSSNVCTRVFESIDRHPIVDLHRQGVVVTINTDDPHMFGTNLSEEYRRVAACFGLRHDDVADLVKNGIRSSFMSTERRGILLREVDQALGAIAK